MNPETNRFEPLFKKEPKEPTVYNKAQEAVRYKRQQAAIQEIQEKLIPRVDLVCADGSPVPQNWGIFTVGETIVLKNHTYRVAYINESSITLEPVGPVIVDYDI